MTEQKKTRKYVVIMTNTLNYKVGQVVSLSAAKAKALVGKVRPQREVELENEVMKISAEVTAENDALRIEVVALKEELAELKKPAVKKPPVAK